MGAVGANQAPTTLQSCGLVHPITIPETSACSYDQRCEGEWRRCRSESQGCDPGHVEEAEWSRQPSPRVGSQSLMGEARPNYPSQEPYRPQPGPVPEHCHNLPCVLELSRQGREPSPPPFATAPRRLWGKGGCHGNISRLAAAGGRSEAGPQCEQLSYPNMSPTCLNDSDLQQCPSLSRTHLQRTRPSGQPLPKSLPTFSGSGLCPASSKAQFRRILLQLAQEA